MIEEVFEVVCEKCKHKSRIYTFVREDGFNEWEAYHCSYCGLKIDDVKAARTPRSERIVNSET